MSMILYDGSCASATTCFDDTVVTCQVEQLVKRSGHTVLVTVIAADEYPLSTSMRSL